MTPIPFFMIGGLLAFLIWGEKKVHDEATQQLKQFYKLFGNKIVAEKKSVACSTYTWGAKNRRYLFRRCDLIFLEDAMVIVPFYTVGKYKVLCNYLYISDNGLMGIGKLNRFNSNADDGAVFFEFGEAGFTKTSVGIRLKNLTSDEKSLIKIGVS